MEINEKSIEAWIAYWKNYIGNYNLPSWESIPDFGLYMEQVITFLKDSLSYMDDVRSADPIITSAAINNYVRKKIISHPIKKRYYRSHIAYLLIICILKQSLSISEIQTLIPMDLDDEALHKTYDAFMAQHKRAAEYFIRRVDRVKDAIMRDRSIKTEFRNNAADIVVDVALISSFSKLLSEKLLSEGNIAPNVTETVILNP